MIAKYGRWREDWNRIQAAEMKYERVSKVALGEIS
jgi:hypothetical protein